MIIKQDLNKAVFTLRQIVNRERDVLFVIHDVDDEWQFLSGETASLEDMMIISFDQIIQRDETLVELIDLKEGYEATRPDLSTNWSIQRSK